MKIERIRIEGFGALRDLDLAWPEGRVLLAVDPNETGKTTLCEAIVAALSGLPKKRGEASVVRALKTLDTVLLDMPEPAAGAKISVDTEIARLGRRVEALKQRRAVLAARRAVAAQASARLSGCAKAHDEARRAAEIAALAEVLAHRRALARRRETLASALSKQREAESEARALAPEAELFSDGALAAVDRLREERGNRPQVLEAARASYAENLRLAAREAEETGRRFGPAARLGDAERAGLEEMLRAELATSRDLAAGERAQRVKLARSLVGAAALLVPFVAWLALRSAGVPVYMTASIAVFVLSLGLFGGIAWARAIRYRVGDEARAREEEAVSRRKAVELRKRLSNMRLRLDRLARGAGYRDTSSLLKAHRRARAAAEPRRQLVAVTARRDDAKERLQSLGEALRPHRAPLALPEGLPTPEEAERALSLLADLARAKQDARTREEVFAREKERLDREGAGLSEIEMRLRDAVGRTGVPLSLPLAESLLAVEAGRRKAVRFRRLLEHELPARRESAGEGEATDLASRLGVDPQ